MGTCPSPNPLPGFWRSAEKFGVGLTVGVDFDTILSNLGDTITLYPIPPVFKMMYLSPRCSMVPSRKLIILKDYHYRCSNSTPNLTLQATSLKRLKNWLMV